MDTTLFCLFRLKDILDILGISILDIYKGSWYVSGNVKVTDLNVWNSSDISYVHLWLTAWSQAYPSLFVLISDLLTIAYWIDYFDEDGFIDDHIEFLVLCEEGMIVHFYLLSICLVIVFTKRFIPTIPSVDLMV